MKNLCLLTAVTLATASLAGCADQKAFWAGPPPIAVAASCGSGVPIKGTTTVTLSNFTDVGGQKSVTLSTDPAMIEVGCWRLNWVIAAGPFDFSSPGITFSPALPSTQAPGFPPSYNVWLADPAAPGTWKYTILAQTLVPGVGVVKWKCDPRVIATASKAPEVPQPTADQAAAMRATTTTQSGSVPCTLA